MASEFDSRVVREWKRYTGEFRRVLQRELMERFLHRHWPGRNGTVLELGPGPGRFTGTLLTHHPETLLEVDISRGGLAASRKRYRRHPQRHSIRWIQGAGEHLPLPDGTVDVAVVFGNIVSFAANDGDVMVRELGRVLRRSGLLLVEFPHVVGSLQDFLLATLKLRILRKVLRDLDYFQINHILETGYQPYAPDRLAQWEFKFYTVAEARKMLAEAGFTSLDVMSVGPLTAYQENVARIAKKEKGTWEELLRLEEFAGRREGAWECGHGFLLAARKSGTRPPE